jgi:YfiH family protein
MHQRKVHALSLWLFENLLKYEEIGHFISARTGGHSSAPYDSLNLSFNVGDNHQKVLKNRQLLAGALGISPASLTTAKQIHGSHVKIVSESLLGKDSTGCQDPIDEADAMVTDVPNVCLMILLADCVPIVLYDPTKRVVGVAHAGWKGTLQAIAKKTVEVFQGSFGCSPEDIIAGIGPSIGPCCYEVGSEVVFQVEHALGTKKDYVRNESSHTKGYLDLWTANLKQLVQAGISEKNIEIAQICTHDHPSLFFSYRHEKGKTGRFGAGIFLRPGPKDGS